LAWLWANPSVVDFGARGADRGETQTVWLYADPFGVLGLAPGADVDEVRRAYRRLVRLHHPDVAPVEPGSLARFQEITSAYTAIIREPQVQVEPLRGAWWSVTGFPDPDLWRVDALSVAGIEFERRGLDSLRAGQLVDEVRVSYAGQVLSLPVRYTPRLRARAGVLAESLLLVALCLTIVPVMAVLLGIDMFLVSNGSLYVTWGIALLILGAGYGALAAVLRSTGHRIYPRAVVRRTRVAISALGAIHGSHR
jgi:DnaJ domain